MTVEVAILNRETAVLAADSAVTIFGGNKVKVLNSVTKIFSLTEGTPVAVMYFGNGGLMGISWEIIIKLYKKDRGSNKYGTIKEYADNFLEYINTFDVYMKKDYEEKFLASTISNYLTQLRDIYLKEGIQSLLNEKSVIDQSDVKKCVTELINNLYKEWDRCDCRYKNKQELINRIRTEYEKVIVSEIKEVFENLPLTEKSRSLLIDICSSIFVVSNNNYVNEHSTGIVICGFGEKEIYPSYSLLEIDSFVCNILNSRLKENFTIKNENQNSGIVAFAQPHTVNTFLKGISSGYGSLFRLGLTSITENIIDNILKDSSISVSKEDSEKIKNRILGNLFNNMNGGFGKMREIFEMIDPGYSMVLLKEYLAYMPKNDMAEMAESLVQLTCLRKKITIEEETVGGPIDVAVITKGDGLVWFRRKPFLRTDHYLNKK